MKLSLPVHKLLEEILKLSKKKKIKLYLVGGVLRDILLLRDKENPDIDFCLKARAISFARDVAKEIKGGFVVLDKEHGCARVVKIIEGKVYTLDFADFRGKDLKHDLLHRDFTINTLSISLDDFLRGKEIEDNLIDLFGAKRDLQEKIVRVTQAKSFHEDPLRILRAFSMEAIFNLKIEPLTIKLIKKEKEKLSRVSGERIRDELFKILDTDNSFKYLLEMDKLKVLRVALPEIEVMRGVSQGPYHHLNVWEHTLETIRQLEILLESLKGNKEIQDYLNTVISSQRRRFALLKLAALLHDVGKPKAKRREGGKIKFYGHERIGYGITKGLIERLKLSNDEKSALKKMILWHLRPGFLADNEKITPRAVFRYFRDSTPESVAILLLSVADQRATQGKLSTKTGRIYHEKVAFDLIKEYFNRQKVKKPVRLLNGDVLMAKFKLKPSPLIGKILREIEELQAIGKIKTKEQALKVARKILKKR